MEKNIYSSGEYTNKNQSYHTEDSEFKWSNFKKILKNSNINLSNIKSILDVGCGVGEILFNAKKSNLFMNSSFVGYDINPDAIKLAKKNNNGIDFENKNFLDQTKKKDYDLILAADVFEHIENSYSFLKSVRNNGKYFLFNIPLEISFLSLIRNKNIFKHSYDEVGHLHFYTKKTAIITLEHCGFKILDCIYAKNRFQEIKNSLRLKKLLISIPQYILDKFNEDLACNIFGGYSLIVLAQKNE
jgi:2-polyprenyl-3-methyl-5-hydroxy-6-metoxy-1,4-benzoquinol methylase